MKFSKFNIFLCIALLLASCATVRKLSAADILSNTKLEVANLTVDSVAVNPNLFESANMSLVSSLLPNPQVVTLVQNLARGIIEQELGKAYLSAEIIATSKDKDSLWIRSFTATLSLDTIMELPLTIKDSSVLAPGTNRFVVTTLFPIDKRLFALRDVTRYRIKGVLQVALKADGETVPLDFDIERKITPEEVRALEDRARETLLNGIVNDWVGAILPNK